VLEFCLVLAKRQNGFFFELAEAIAEEIRAAGHGAFLSVDGFPPPREDLVYVLLPPHEYYRLEGLNTEPPPAILARTIFVCAEQPGTSFFDDDVFLAARAGAVFDINARSIGEFRRRGVDGVRHLPLGWTPTWSPVAFEPGQPFPGAVHRPIDVLHMGIYSANRGRALAAAAKHIVRWESKLVLADHTKANSEPQANFVMNEPKWDMMRRSRVLLNVHVAERPYFEWLRVVQAIGAGCAVVSEHSAGYAPLVPGQHVVFGGAQALGLLAQELLDDEERRWALTRDAWLFLRDELPFSRSIATLIEAGQEIAAAPLPPDDRTFTFAPRAIERKQDASLEPGVAMLAETPERYPSDVAGPDTSRIRAGIKDLRLELMGLRREARRRELRDAQGGDPPRALRVRATAAHAAARPHVSVVTALYNYERHIAAALDSAAASRGVDLELVVVDDGSTDGSLDAVQAWCDRNEAVPALLVRHPVNQGLGAARNTAIDFARGEYVFVLDADNEVYAQGIARLAGVLDQNPEAVFAYGMLETFDHDGSIGLQSVFPWDPKRFRTGNFIDAMALVRRTWLRDHGGYTTDRRLHGWEDFDLWCRVAEHGRDGVHLQQIVARYRVTKHSMLTLTDISSVQAVSLLIERHPQVMAGVTPPW
jgi:hypothetical protein